MRALFVIHTPKDPHSAVYAIHRELAVFLESRGHRATILGPEDCAFLKRRSARWIAALFPLWIAAWLSRHAAAYDLAVFHSYSGWVANLLRRRHGSRSPRTVTVFHGLEPLHYARLKDEMERAGRPLGLRFRLAYGVVMPRLLRLSCRRSDHVVCLNAEEARYLAGHRWAHPSRVSVLGNGVSSEFFSERAHRGGARRLLFVGQWQERKGVRYLTDAFAALARTRADLELVCAGTRLGAGEVRADFPPDVRDRVSVRPVLGAAELAAAYRESDIFVFPSLFEGFSRALLEAMAAGLPIVATGAGAAADLLRSEENALVVPRSDARALGSAIERLVEDPGLRERLGRAARADAAAWELGRVHEQHEALLERVAGTGAGGPVGVKG